MLLNQFLDTQVLLIKGSTLSMSTMKLLSVFVVKYSLLVRRDCDTNGYAI